MASYALLIGTKDNKRVLVADGSGPEIRKKFKLSDGEGFDRLEVVESTIGRTRSRHFVKKSKAATKIATKTPKSSKA